MGPVSEQRYLSKAVRYVVHGATILKLRKQIENFIFILTNAYVAGNVLKSARLALRE